MSATDMPGWTCAAATTASNSPTRSRTSSVEKASDTIGATSRPEGGKLSAASPSARQAASASARQQNASVPPARRILVDVFHVDLLARHPLARSSGHEAVEIAVEHVARRRRGDPGTQVLDQLIRLQDVRSDLMAPADVGLGRGRRV